MSESIRLVVFDWAGTAIDHGCFAPVAPFMQAFAEHGVHVTSSEARGPMGLKKRDHLVALLALPGIAQRWRERHGRDATEADVESLFATFMARQMEAVDQHSQLVPGLLACVAELRRRSIRLATSTGYFRAAFERVLRAAHAQGYDPDVSFCADDVPEGRPAPWMIFRAMEQLRIYPPHHVLKIGDTIPDIEEGRNAGVWSVGVTASSSEVGCTEAEWTALPTGEQQIRLKNAGEKLVAAGAHRVLATLAEVPALLDELEQRLASGQRP